MLERQLHRRDIRLVKYNTACQALAEARSVDEVKEIRNLSAAMQVYARQAKNCELEADALEIRMRATRRLHQMLQQQKETIGLAKGTRGQGRPKIGGVRNTPPNDVPTLAEAGIDKNLAKECRRLGTLTDKEFEAAVRTARENVGRVVKLALRDQKGKVRAKTKTPRAASLGGVENPQERSHIPRSARLAAVADDPAQPQPSRDAMLLIELVLTIDPEQVADLLKSEFSHHERSKFTSKLRRILDGVAERVGADEEAG